MLFPMWLLAIITCVSRAALTLSFCLYRALCLLFELLFQAEICCMFLLTTAHLHISSPCPPAGRTQLTAAVFSLQIGPRHVPNIDSRFGRMEIGAMSKHAADSAAFSTCATTRATNLTNLRTTNLRSHSAGAAGNDGKSPLRHMPSCSMDDTYCARTIAPARPCCTPGT